MLNVKNVKTETETLDTETTKRTVWDVEGDFTMQCGTVISVHTVTRIDIEEEDDDYVVTMISAEYTVKHAATEKDIACELYYNNEADFAACIQDVVGAEVQFTEQGMQDDEYASLELA